MKNAQRRRFRIINLFTLFFFGFLNISHANFYTSPYGSPDSNTLVQCQFESSNACVNGDLSPNNVKANFSNIGSGIYNTKSIIIPSSGVDYPPVGIYNATNFNPQLGTIQMWVKPSDLSSNKKQYLFGLKGVRSLDGDQYKELVLGEATTSTAEADSYIYFADENGIDPNNPNLKSTIRSKVPRGMATGDINGDKIPDLVIAMNAADAVYLILGPIQPGQTYAAPSTQLAVPDPQGLVMADVDNDNDLDILVASYAGGVLGFENDGSGNFTAMANMEIPAVPAAESLSSGDVNGDGVLDLVISSFNPSFPALVMLGEITTNGKYRVVAQGASMLLPLALGNAMGDLNRDGWLDVALARTYNNEVAIHLNQGNGVFLSTPSTIIPTNKPFTLGVKDINNDGNLDLLTANWGNGASDEFISYAHLGPDFINKIAFDSLQDAVSVTINDFNEDGLSVFYHSGEGNISPLHKVDVNGNVIGTTLFDTMPTALNAAGPGSGSLFTMTGGTQGYGDPTNNENSFEIYLLNGRVYFAMTDNNNKRHETSMAFPTIDKKASENGFRVVTAEWDTAAGTMMLSVDNPHKIANRIDYSAGAPLEIGFVSKNFRLGTDFDNQQSCEDCEMDDIRISNVRRSQIDTNNNGVSNDWEQPCPSGTITGGTGSLRFSAQCKGSVPLVPFN